MKVLKCTKIRELFRIYRLSIDNMKIETPLVFSNLAAGVVAQEAHARGVCKQGVFANGGEAARHGRGSRGHSAGQINPDHG